MNKCLKCNLNVADDGIMCPLCHSVLEKEIDDSSTDNFYPDVVKKTKKINKVFRWMLGFSILLEAILIFINYKTYHATWWSFICGLGFLYAYISARMVLSNTADHVMKLWLQSIGIAIVTLVLDHLLGYRGWSVNYAFPVIILSVHVIVLILIMARVQTWTNYLMLQIFLLLASLACVGLSLLGVITWPLLSQIALLTSVIVLVCFVFMGGKKAETEIKRKFHI